MLFDNLTSTSYEAYCSLQVSRFQDFRQPLIQKVSYLHGRTLQIIYFYLCTTSVQVPKIAKEMERRGETPEETSVMFHATLASTAAL